MKLSISYLKSALSKEQTITKINDTSANYLHVDIMDGIFAGTNNYAPQELTSLLNQSTKKLDVHLMMENPKEAITFFQTYHPQYITIPVEILKDQTLLSQIHSSGIACGLAINPETDITALTPYLKEVDLILVLSVHPGKGGQKFIPETIDKLKQLKKWQQNFSFAIEVDGGINDETLPLVKPYVDICVSGSFVCMQDDYEKQIQKLKKL